MKYQMIIAGACLATILFVGACSASGPSTKQLAEGEQLFNQYCALCHGQDGKLQLNGAFDITKSEFTIEQRIDLMKNGRNLMTPFEGILTDDQMQAIAYYAVTLKE